MLSMNTSKMFFKLKEGKAKSYFIRENPNIELRVNIYSSKVAR